MGIVLLLSLKQWELRTGAVVGGRARAPVGSFFHAALVWVERILPTLVRVFARRLVRATSMFVHKAAALGVLWAEYALERVLDFLRKTTSSRKGMGEASVFLREVAEHKRKLLKSRTVRAKVTVE